MLNKKILLLLMPLFFGRVNAQDAQFTQFYAAPMYLNPSFAGLTYEHRFTANYRRQWPGIRQSYSSYMAAYDYNLSDLNAGVGGFVWQDRAGSPNLVTTQGGVNFAYKVKINKLSEMRGGLMLAMTQKNIDNSGLVFNDQLISGSAVSSDYRPDKVNYLDMGAGVLYNGANIWLGVAARHINQANTSMVGNVEVLPVHLSVHGGYRYIIGPGSTRTRPDEFVSASVHYRKQDKNDQLDVGAYYFKSFLNIGLWYRGLPFKRYKPGYPNRESIAVLLGVEIPDKSLRVGYSYDLTLSALGISNTKGAHEVSVVYEIAKKKRRTRRVLVNCPKF